MGENLDFTEQLKSAIKEKSDWFNQEQLCKLSENYHLLHTCVRNLYDVLVKRALISPDPYKSERKISEIVAPDESPFSENERSMAIGSRFSEYESMLDFICTYVKFSTEYLDIQKIKRLNDLNNSFQWSNLTLNNSKTNTRGLAALIQEARTNNTQMQLSMLTDAITKSSQAVTEISSILKDLTDFQRESYKLQIRINFYNHPSFDKEKAFSSTSNQIAEIKRLFPQVMGKSPYYSELINEIVEEDQGSDSQARQQLVLTKLQVSRKVVKEKVSTVDTKEMILDSFHTLTNLNEIYEQVAEKLNNNVNILEGSKNIVFCTQCVRIHPIIQSHGCASEDCTNYWRQSQLKINLANGECVNDCSLTTTNNKYLYLSKCYISCPEGTYTDNLECKDCHPDCKTCIKPEDLNGSNCQLCKSSDKCLKKGNCISISESKNGYYLDENDNSIKICKCDLIKCSKCSEESLKINLCLTCNEGYYPKENDENNKNSFIDCYQSQEGYYLDNNNNNPFFKLCYESCQKCDKGGNEFYHNCIECKSDYYFELNRNSYKNCYINCPYYYYHDKDKYLCTEFLECPENYSKLINGTNECIYKCEEHSEYIYEFKNKCYKECPESTIAKRNGTLCQLVCTEDKPFEMISLQECFKYCPIKDILTGECILNYKTDEVDYETKAHDIMLGNIEHGFTSLDYDILHLEEGKEDIIEFRKMVVTLTTVRNQKNITNNNNNKTFIDLKECEASLRKENNISDDEDLFIKKIDVIQDEFRIPKIIYEIYYKKYDINGTHLSKLNLSACKNDRIDLSISIVINENLDKLNVSGGYYNDICYPTLDSKIDLNIEDRQKMFSESNETVCQEDCFLSDYDEVNHRAKCSCNVIDAILSFADMKINGTILLQQFTDIKNLINIEIIFCYKQLFCKEGITNNICCYIVFPFILFHFIVIIIFYCNQKEELYKKIKDIYFSINNWDLVKEEEKNRLQKLKKQNHKKNKNIRLFGNNNAKSNNKKMRDPMTDYIRKNLVKIKKEKNNFPPKKKGITIKKRPNIRFNNQTTNIFDKINNQKSSINKIVQKTNEQNKKEEIIQKVKKIMAYNPEEINTLNYITALKADKRTYCKYYTSLIKTKHIFVFSFFYSDDYNSKIIKIDLFFVGFITFFAVNALFFNDNTMHKILLDRGSYNIIYQLTQIIYSSLISSIFNIILKLFAISEVNILEFKKDTTKQTLKIREKKLDKKLKMKFILYFLLSFVFLVCFWYYLSVFGAIFKNTQLHLIKDTLISFGLSLVYPFGIYLIPGFCRIPALFNIKNKREILYKISLLLQVI